MNRRAAQKAQTRARILEAAAHLFAERGIAATTTADIARAAGLSHGAVFVHFETRDSLIDAVASTLFEQLTDRLHSLVERGGSFREALQVHLDSLAEREDLYRRFAAEAATLPEISRNSWIGLQSAISYHLSAPAEREMRAGSLRRCEFALLFNTWIGLLHHYLLHRDLFAPGSSVLRALGPTLLDHFHRLASHEVGPNTETNREQRRDR